MASLSIVYQCPSEKPDTSKFPKKSTTSNYKDLRKPTQWPENMTKPIQRWPCFHPGSSKAWMSIARTFALCGLPAHRWERRPRGGWRSQQRRPWRIAWSEPLRFRLNLFARNLPVSQLALPPSSFGKKNTARGQKEMVSRNISKKWESTIALVPLDSVLELTTGRYPAKPSDTSLHPSDWGVAFGKKMFS